MATVETAPTWAGNEEDRRVSRLRTSEARVLRARHEEEALRLLRGQLGDAGADSIIEILVARLRAALRF